MAIDMNTIKLLKEKTGAGLMNCKKALEETNGNFEKAIILIKEKGFKSVDEKSERETKEGVVSYFFEEDKGIIIEVNCETDFVARNNEFKSFVKEIALHLLKKEITSLDEKAENIRKEAVMKFGENILVRRWNFVKYTSGNIFDTYQHGDKISVIVEGKIDKNDTEAKTLLHDIALQIASMAPKVVSSDNIDKSFVETKKQEFIQEFISIGKPQSVAEKAALGKLSKLFSELCLYDQVFIKDDKSEKKVKDIIDNYKKNNQKEFEIIKFYRFQLGE